MLQKQRTWLSLLGTGALLLLLSRTGGLSAQGMELIGRVLDESGKPLPGATVLLKNGQSEVGAYSGPQGEFKLKITGTGLCTLEVSFVGYQVFTKEIESHRTGAAMTVQLQLATGELDEVEVSGTTAFQEIKDTYSVTSVNASAWHNRANTTADLLNTVSGVRVRQEGGLGSRANFSIHGISGKQVKMMIDGVPVEFYGRGMGVEVLPAHIMERVDVYKGAVPIDLGADALGGAFNIVTRQDLGDFIDAGYAFGSFNTHKASLFANKELKEGFSIGLRAYYNHSNNDYPIDVEIPNEQGNFVGERVECFHDRYSNYAVGADLKWQNKSWADLVKWGVAFSGMQDQLQHNVIMAQPYGSARFQENAWNTNLQFIKDDLLPGLALSNFTGFSQGKSLFIDTTSNIYNWRGEVVGRRSVGGEISSTGNYLQLETRQFVNRLHLSYPLKGGSSLNANWFASHYHRAGEDSIATERYPQDYYQRPMLVTKNIAGVDFRTKPFGQKTTSITALKFYHYHSDGFYINNSAQQVVATNGQQQLGWSQTMNWKPVKNSLVKFSYEYATRIPDEFELFGDFVFTRPNPDLVPETSHNFNLGLQYKSGKMEAELTGFLRMVDNIIYLRASQHFSQYQNLLKAMVRGIEGNFQVEVAKNFQFRANATFQDIRNRTEGQGASINNRYYNARLPNIPYFFANVELNYVKKGVGNPDNELRWWFQSNYVNEFFLYWAVDGIRDSKAIIPTQWLQNTGVSYSFSQNKFTCSLETHNLTNAQAFDNFNVQRPGRTFHIKLRAHIFSNQ